MDVRIKRVYEEPEDSDGVRVLVDRLWPRGMKKSDAAIDLWLKDVAPSSQLRKDWHADPAGHDPAHFAEFATDYRSEFLEDPAKSALAQLVGIAKDSFRLTLLYGAKDEEINHAVVLRDAVVEHGEESGE